MEGSGAALTVADFVENLNRLAQKRPSLNVVALAVLDLGELMEGSGAALTVADFVLNLNRLAQKRPSLNVVALAGLDHGRADGGKRRGPYGLRFRP